MLLYEVERSRLRIGFEGWVLRSLSRISGRSWKAGHYAQSPKPRPRGTSLPPCGTLNRSHSPLRCGGRLADAQGQYEPSSQISAAAEDVRRLSGRAVEPEAHLSDREFLRSQPNSGTNVAELTVPQIQRASVLADIESYQRRLVAAEEVGDVEEAAHIRREIADREKFLHQADSEA